MVYAELDTVLRCLLYRDEVPSSEWILFNHQLGPLARVSLAFFFVPVPVVVAIWDYYGLCWVRHRPPVPTVSWWGPLQLVNPLQPLIRSAGRSVLAFFFVAVPVRVVIWDYYGLCWVRHRPPVPIVSWWGPLQLVNPLQPLIRSAGRSFLAFFFVVVPVGVAIWHYYGLCWVRHRPPVLIVPWCGPFSEWILFSHQLGPLARVSLAFFFVAVKVGVAIWDYYGLCWVRHRPPVLIVSWWGPLQWVSPLQPSIRSAGQRFFSLILCCCSSRGCNMVLLWFVLG
jgi:NADPH-dependent 7-cyano-7-deazaguanine reductase QueF-like protein